MKLHHLWMLLTLVENLQFFTLLQFWYTTSTAMTAVDFSVDHLRLCYSIFFIAGTHAATA